MQFETVTCSQFETITCSRCGGTGQFVYVCVERRENRGSKMIRKLNAEQSYALVSVEEKIVYTFNDYHQAKAFASTVPDSVMCSPEHEVYQVIETELLVKQ